MPRRPDWPRGMDAFLRSVDQATAKSFSPGRTIRGSSQTGGRGADSFGGYGNADGSPSNNGPGIW